MPAAQRKGDANTGGAPIATIPQKTVFVNGVEVAVKGSNIAPHGGKKKGAHGAAVTGDGSPNVFVEGKPVNRTDDIDSCADPRVGGSPDVFVN